MLKLFRKARSYYTKTSYVKGEHNLWSPRPAPHAVKIYEENDGTAEAFHIVNAFNFSYNSDKLEALRMVEYVLGLYGKKIDIQ